jgi:hypothetical protein
VCLEGDELTVKQDVVQQASETAEAQTGKRLPTRKCQYPPCGVDFEAKRINQKYHQPACRQADWRRRHGHGLTIMCPHCGGEIDAQLWVRGSRSP